MCGGTPRQSLLGASDYRLLCCPRPYAYGAVDLSKKGTSGKMLPNDSNLTAEEVRKSPKSPVDGLIEAGDIAPSNPRRIDPRQSTNHLMIRTCAQTDALSKLLIEKGIITQQEFLAKIAEERATYQRMLNTTRQ